MAKNLQEEKLKALYAVMKHVPQYGWSEETLQEASSDLGQKPSYIKLLFPSGVHEIVDMMVNILDDQTIELAKQEIEKGQYRTTEKIKIALACRFRINEQYRDTIIKTVHFLCMPWNFTLGLKVSWRSMDRIWTDIGLDQSTDTNYYTKRALLHAAFTASMNHWMHDHSEGRSSTVEFIDSAIDNVMKAGKSFGEFKSKVASIINKAA